MTEIDLTTAAFATRKANFADDISFYAPGLKRYHTTEFEQKSPRAFLPISLTGNACALQCDHCEAKILEPMIACDKNEGLFSLCQRLATVGTEGILLSGGSNHNGAVPLHQHFADLKRVKNELGLRVMVHCGLVTEETCAALKEAQVEAVMLDIIGANETIREVYHLDATIADFDRSLELLNLYELSVRPHIILGLHYGRMLGEETALEMIAKYPVHALILVVMTPLIGTRMQNVAPPGVVELKVFFQKARLRMPDTPIMIGCARPPGQHRQQLDRAAIDCGLNGIAYPAEGIVEYSRTKGLQPGFVENTCSCGC